MKCFFTKIQSNIAIWQYIAIHPNAIRNMVLTHIVSPLAATITFTKRKGAATKRGQLARRFILHSYNFLMNTDGFTLTFIATVKMKSEALEVNL